MLNTANQALPPEGGSLNHNIPILQLVGVGKDFAGGAVRAVHGASLSVRAGEILSILGPSGCGKSTMMRMIAGLEDPTEGDIRIAGRSVLGLPAHKRNVGLVFQSLAIFPHMTVWQNVAFGLRMKQTPKAKITAKVNAALETVQLPARTFAQRLPGQLSGGQLQRVALARTLVTEPALILFDEPMAALDRRLRDHMAVELRSIQKALNIAAIYVTHDQETASVMSDRIAIMNSGQVVQVGTPADIYRRPSNRFVAEFLGDVNCLRARSQPADQTDRPGSLILGGAIGDMEAGTLEQELFFRPEHVLLQIRRKSPDDIAGTIIDVQFASGLFNWRVRLSDGQELVARTTSDLAGAGSGTAVWVQVSPDNIFTPQG
ncbi:ABC transporter ATP-binding protein [Mesorhizobium sp. M00.F.Ca.ET.216.01.1.1]|uniref:ABC transporter ATP-binding protein n=1 Tax=Mesorhizobium sp. M00.F.Ca.ET.216.01.1.1 TaxID=2500528 RepID=UPI000FD7A23E|nr:ABC transporter ATP-binding protein [Mesorhizobium sp. M00.F.Ca.ET.216.01.1.1]TGQ29430.1 ABC transporter ATP-binding protein [Mesorhizobium sp. M00.F.Ca.ET.216.01.1.1]